MAQIQLAEFTRRTLAGSIEQLVSECLIDDDPWIFREAPSLYSKLKQEVQSGLQADDLECLIVGSAKYGYSVSPDRFGYPFGTGSDVDIVVVSGNLFDEIWHALLGWRYPWHLRKWTERDRRWGYSHLEDHFVGWIAPDKIRISSLGIERIPKPLVSIANAWFEAFKRVGQIDKVSGHEANGRLFRSRSHLEMYQHWGLGKIRQQLAKRTT